MSSTYVHYSASSSIPSDYGVLARYTGNTHTEGDATDPPPADMGNSSSRARSRSPEVLRTSRVRAPYVPVAGTAKIVAGPNLPDAPITEATPLLVPRIIEEVDEQEAQEAHGEAEPKHHNVFWEEMKILGKYTIPIVGYVSLCPLRLGQGLTHSCL
jgi:hypothetical protein